MSAIYKTKSGSLVKSIGPEWHIPGGYVREVERLEDLDIPEMRISDGSLHPAARKGARWNEPVVNLTLVAVGELK